MTRPESARRPARNRAPSAVVALLVAVLATLGSAGSAIAAFSASGLGGGSVTSGHLAPPMSVAGSQVVGTSNVNLSWVAPVGAPAATRYYAVRTPFPSGTAAGACATSAASPIGTTSCTDAGVAAGSYTYTVVAVLGSWTATSAPTAALNVLGTTQTIAFTSSPGTPAVGTSYAVAATGGASGNPVTFTSATPATCAVSASTVTFAHAGTCTVNANQAGNAQYAAAPQSQQSFTVAKASQALIFTSIAPVVAAVGGAGYVPTATGGTSGNPVVLTVDATTSANCSINLGMVTYQHVGSCTIDANQAGTTDYSAASQVQQSYAVGKGAQAIAFTSVVPSAAKVNGSTYAVAATGGASGSAVTFTSATPSVCTIAGATVSFPGAGTCTIIANQVGNADYLAASPVQQTFTVSRLDQTITFSQPTSPQTAPGGGAFSASTSSGLAVTFSTPSSSSVCTVSGSLVNLVGAGTCLVNADQAGNATYNAAPTVQRSITVMLNQTITFTQPTTPAEAGTNAALVATASSGLTVTFSTASSSSVCTVTGSTVTYVGLGACQIIATQSGDATYNSTSTARNISVKLGQTITFSQPTSPQTAPGNGALSATSSSGLAVTFTSATTSVCTVSGTTVSFVAAGTCLVNADQASSGPYNPAPTVQRSITVMLNQTLSFTQPTSPAPAGGNAALVATASSGLTVTFSTASSSSICTVAGSTVSYAGVGSCQIVATQAGNATYNPITAQRNVTVAQAGQTISFNPPTAATAGTAGALSAAASSGLAVTFATISASTICTVSGTTVTYVGAGACVINANQAGNANYTAAPQVQRTVTVSLPFAITSRSSGNPQSSTTISGTGVAGATITIYVCSGNLASCGPGSPTLDSTSPQTATVAANGTWTSGTFSKLGNGSWTAQAVQSSPAATSNAFTFTTP